jgi:tetratricopeptide (TPR) repeat protein
MSGAFRKCCAPFFLSLGLSVSAASACAATEIETCRDNQAEATARLAACNAVIADDKVTGKPKAYATWYLGDSLLKKRDYDGALGSFNKALELDPDNASSSIRAGLPTSTRATTIVRWPTTTSPAKAAELSRALQQSRPDLSAQGRVAARL